MNFLLEWSGLKWTCEWKTLDFNIWLRFVIVKLALICTHKPIPQVGFCNFFGISSWGKEWGCEKFHDSLRRKPIYFFPLRNIHVTLIFDVGNNIIIFSCLFFFRTDITLMVVWNFQKDYLIIQLCYVTDWVGWKGKNSTNK